MPPSRGDLLAARLKVQDAFFQGGDTCVGVGAGGLEGVHAGEVAAGEAFQAAQDFGLHGVDFPLGWAFSFFELISVAEILGWGKARHTGRRATADVEASGREVLVAPMPIPTLLTDFRAMIQWSKLRGSTIPLVSKVCRGCIFAATG